MKGRKEERKEERKVIKKDIYHRHPGKEKKFN
jgi:hypothetical protein